MSKDKFNINILHRKLNKQNLIGLLIITMLAILGASLLISSHAQSPYSSVEANTGSLTSPATIQTGGGSTSGSYVQFGSELAIHISNGQLVDGNGKTIRLLGADIYSTDDHCTFTNNPSISADPLNAAEASAIASWKMNAIRIPLNEDCWLGINGINPAYSGINYQNAIKNFVTDLNNDGIYAVLDLHCTAPGTFVACKNPSGGLPDLDHAPAFWTSVANTFKSNPAVMFDLYNEPYTGQNPTNSDWSCWVNGCVNSTTGPETYTTVGMQQLINTVRATGAKQPIIVGSLIWAGDPCGTQDAQSTNGICQILNPTYKPIDTLNQLAVDFHNYGGVCSSLNCWNYTLHSLQSAKIPWITLEFGEFDCTPNYMNTYMNWADQNNMSYLAWDWMINDGPNGGYTSCVPGATGYSNPENTELIKSWDGTPSIVSPQGANYKAHLLLVSPY